MPKPRNIPRKRAPTLADVGRAAGVSAMAVSAVLNASSSSVRISADTEERIRKAAKELNYRPNIAARALVNRRMNAIGAFFVVEGKELNNYFLEVFNGIIDGASDYKQNVTVFTLGTWSDARSQLERAFDGRIDGMILIAPVVTAAFASGLDANIPCVSLHANAHVDGLINIESDEEKGAYDMVRHLLDKGHREVMHISGPRGLIGVERRIQGYIAALKTVGVEARDELLISTDYSDDGGRKVMRKWLQENDLSKLPHALFCANDSIALGCMEALAEAGLRVPDDISVCGFDDTLVARATVPRLTTVRQPLRAMGKEAVSILMKRIDGSDEDRLKGEDTVVFPTEVVIRNSVGERQHVCET